MLDVLMSFIAPHHCCGCGKTGLILCDSCKYNIVFETNPRCLVCHRPTNAMWLCSDCKAPYERAWAVGERCDELKALIDKYKFQRVRSAYKVLAELLSEALPSLPSNAIVVPIPTISSHIRQRGYDHTLLIAKYFARLRKLNCQQLLLRSSQNTQQKHANARQRQNQAKNAFIVSEQLNPNITYLIIDDITTTGATLRYASKTLRQNGAKNVWIGVIAYQSLD